ncbi:hypothetical protein GBA65_19955 [Rubrobacter marinus]|uniref:Uncharacterized protein n=1 Tax=Rubrobacter marinus TaxID=2653852 RepID=A0A6G8Q1R4_9ACTN|nr:hypothetical protein [Rubrobacter marinus]QIN80411.1 hypothetical protein GBA65_19955 [Rubrobacter marinus]
MSLFHAIAVQHFELVLYAFTLLAGVAPEALALLQRRRSGFRSRRRRRRSGGLFGAFGALLLIFLFGGVAILLLGALALFRLVTGRRR